MRALYNGKIQNSAQLQGIIDGIAKPKNPLFTDPSQAQPQRLAPDSGDNSIPCAEQEVASILCHFGSAKARRYRVLWADGDETVERRENFVDLVDGEEVVNEKLQIYLDSQ